MKEAVVVQEIRTYFRDRFPQFSVSLECNVQFGRKRGGRADVVLHQPIGEDKGYFVAIAECKKWPLQMLRGQAREQLRCYLNVTNTRYGMLAVGTDPGNWEFCENKYNNRFAEIDRETFEKGIENWKPVSPAALTVNLQEGQGTASWWKGIALTLGILFVVTCASFLFLWPDPPEPIVYITRTGKKYHTLDCEFLEKHNVTNKFAIYLDEAKDDYGPCGICYPWR